MEEGGQRPIETPMQAMREWESLVDAALFPRHATTTTVHPAQQRQPRHALQRLLQGPWISVKSRLWRPLPTSGDPIRNGAW